MRVPKYNLAPIGSVISLGRCLGIPLRELYVQARKADRYYYPNEPVEKESGGFRQTYSVSSPLKETQARIHARILRRVEFPPYLFAVKNDDQRRDYVSEAWQHIGCTTLFNIDIESYFDNIQKRLVRKTWLCFFNVAPDVADLLTALTTYSGYLPQGASTSPYLAILLLHDVEPQLELRLRDAGLVYTRFIDDITISSRANLNKEKKTWVIAQVISMLKRYELRIKRGKKFAIRGRSYRQSVHGLNLNSGQPSKSKDERANIRAAVKECEYMATMSRSTDDYQTQWDSVRGRISDLHLVHPREADKLLLKLMAIIPYTN